LDIPISRTSELAVHYLRGAVVAVGTHSGIFGHQWTPESRGAGKLGHWPVAVITWNTHKGWRHVIKTL